MIGLANYLSYAQKHNLKLNRYEGIMIWDHELFSELPQEVLFMPTAWDKKGTFKEFLEKELTKDNLMAYQIYFQGIRWILPDLQKRLHDTKYTNINLGLTYRSCRASYVALTFYAGIDDINKNEVVSIYNLPIMIAGEKRSIKLQEDSSHMGYAKLYENIDW